MIVDGPNVIDLAIGTDRRIMEVGDSQLTVPSTILPVLLNIKPTTAGGLTTTLREQSFLTEAFINLTNQAAATSNMCTLAKGLWELEISLASAFDFTAAVGTIVSADMKIVFRGAGRRLISRIAAIGSFTDYQRLRLLLDEQTTIQIAGGITGVGQHLDAVGILNAIRIL